LNCSATRGSIGGREPEDEDCASWGDTGAPEVLGERAERVEVGMVSDMDAK
jgi:hypothetical protein